MIYSVKYKINGHLFYRKIRKVKGDGIMPENGNRFFILEDETRIEIPTRQTVFRFSPKRFMNIKTQMEKEAAQDIKVNHGF